jgi:uncharacterized protein DUF6710
MFDSSRRVRGSVSVLDRLSAFLRQGDKTRAPFQATMEMASRIARENPPALRELARVFGRMIQSEWIAQVVTRDEGTCDYPLDPDRAFFDRRLAVTEDGRGWFDLLVKLEREVEVHLATDIVLPWPWSRSSFARCLSFIGTGKKAGAWRQSSNHRVEWWEPIGIGWVIGGNHSIAAGILQGEGRLVVDTVYSMHRLYEHIVCDGAYYRRQADHRPICRVKNAAFASLFEIGRLLLPGDDTPD